MQGALLVATEVGDHAALRALQATLGFTYFEGEYFAQPRIFKHRGVATSGLGSLRRLAELTAGDISFEDLERIISSDVGLSLKLLRYVNSAFFALPRTVSLRPRGAEPPRRAHRAPLGHGDGHQLDSGRPGRARRPRPAPRPHVRDPRRQRVPEERDTLFTIGLFSVADAMLNVPMAEVLESLPFTEEIQAALLRHEGPKGDLLAAVAAYERGEFPTLRRRVLPAPPWPARTAPRWNGPTRPAASSRSALRRTRRHRARPSPDGARQALASGAPCAPAGVPHAQAGAVPVPPNFRAGATRFIASARS